MPQNLFMNLILRLRGRRLTFKDDIILKEWEKYKISHCDLLDLQFTPCGIKMNSKVHVVCKKKKKKKKQFSPYS
jgi:hypothetical protein